MWDNMRTYRERNERMLDDFEEDELERAYKRGCEHGYRKAMAEVYGGKRSGMYGERSWTIEEGYGQRDDRESMNYGQRGGYGQRDDNYGERRRRDSMGRYM